MWLRRLTKENSNLHGDPQSKELLIVRPGGVVGNDLERREAAGRGAGFTREPGHQALLPAPSIPAPMAQPTVPALAGAMPAAWTHHAVGDDQPRGTWAAREEAQRMSTVHDQSLLLCHLGQVGHGQPELEGDHRRGLQSHSGAP